MKESKGGVFATDNVYWVDFGSNGCDKQWNPHCASCSYYRAATGIKTSMMLVVAGFLCTRPVFAMWEAATFAAWYARPVSLWKTSALALWHTASALVL